MPSRLHVKGMLDVNYLFVSCFQKALCEDCGPNNYGLVEGLICLVLLEQKFPPFFDIMKHLSSYGGGIGVVWSSLHALDVPY
jgi:hypothetical protein